MFLLRENDSKRKEWIDPEYQEADYSIFRRNSGDFEVYFRKALIARVESLEAGIEIVNEGIA